MPLTTVNLNIWRRRNLHPNLELIARRTCNYPEIRCHINPNGILHGTVAVWHVQGSDSLQAANPIEVGIPVEGVVARQGLASLREIRTVCTPMREGTKGIKGNNGDVWAKRNNSYRRANHPKFLEIRDLPADHIESDWYWRKETCTIINLKYE
ncbi:hypothetical protein B0H13DRAFT_1858840 [Mycena leptocephala]|nr:hypothetical protein B0H13DRAFT_1858840 [Mycena leptocephala]